MGIRTRREFMVASALSIGSFVISTGLSGCDDNSDDIISEDTDSLLINFNHGVASGDPLQDRVILWTRASPDSEVDSFNITYEVAYDEAFTQLVRSPETAKLTKEGDYTLKVDYQNLEAGTVYFYRFKYKDKVSATGRTKTLPTNTNSVKMAVFSCANYPKGYFNVYKEASLIEDLDVSLHLGDYIYEYGMFNSDGTPGYATQEAQEIGRVLPSDNDTELLELADYRKRYAVYRGDVDTQALHHKLAMISIWDDHEIANDAYKDGAQNHDESEGAFSLRKQVALQAYFEWMPIRPAFEGDNETIYRSFNFGELLSLHMLDTRIIARDKQLAYTDYPELFSQADATNFIADVTSADRAMMGTQQMQWLQSQLSSSNATWQVLGQQVLMGRMQLPAEFLALIGQLDGADEQSYAILLPLLNETLVQLATIKQRALLSDPTLLPEELARINTVLPYNLDAWDGYFFERETILQTAFALNKNLIVLSGDTHNAWANNLKALDNSYQPSIPAGVELACPSVSSPGMEEYVKLSSLEEAQAFEGVIQLLLDDLIYFNAQDRGFLQVNFSPEAVESTWHFVDNIKSSSYQSLASRIKKAKIVLNSNTLTLV